jgi:ubiquinone/menaquinone biosynthesis C-methylase UbiE
VQRAKDKTRKALNNNSLEIKLGDVIGLSYEDNSMDIVTAFQTHYFWSDLHLACREIRRVLRPHGMFILCGDLYKMKYHLDKYQFIDEYPTLLKEEQFSEIEVFPFSGFMISYCRK